MLPRFFAQFISTNFWLSGVNLSTVNPATGASKAGKGVKTYRTLSPLEAAALQGMPADIFKKAGVSDKVAYKQLGIALNIGIIRHLATLLTGKRKLNLASQEELSV